MFITSSDVDQGANGSERCNQSSYQSQFIQDKLKEVNPLRMQPYTYRGYKGMWGR